MVNLAHGYSKTHPMYRRWVAMRQRCTNPNYHQYKDYGGRGITVDPLWDDFAQFLADVGPRPSTRHSLDRIDNDGNYEPGNVKWSTRREQSANRRTRIDSSAIIAVLIEQGVTSREQVEQIRDSLR